jgi:hypothetical protein
MIRSSGLKTYIASRHRQAAQARADEIGEVDTVEGLLRLQEHRAEIESPRQERQE